MNPITREWVDKAEGDFASAQRELRARKSPNFDAACFHCHQCIEKYLKARLHELIASAGIASRRHAEELITSEQVSVNGKVITELGAKADPETDHIKVKGRLLNPLLQKHEHVYVLLNKPKGYLSSMADPKGRPLVTDLIPSRLGRLHPVGRLDFNTEGLLLLTNDGEFTNLITSARNRI